MPISYRIEELREKLDKARDPHKILWNWVKQDAITFQEFMVLTEYISQGS